MRMPFGKYRGQELSEVPESYLCWVLDNCERIGPTLRQAIEGVLGVESAEPPYRPAEATFGGRTTPPRPPPKPPAPPPPRRPNLDRLKGEVMDAVQRCRRSMARTLHPDRGGDTAMMQAANGATDELLRAVADAFASAKRTS